MTGADEAGTAADWAQSRAEAGLAELDGPPPGRPGRFFDTAAAASALKAHYSRTFFEGDKP